jgi:hypothetical protein
MGRVKDININIESYCDTLYNELSGMKTRIDAMKENLARAYGAGSTVYEVHSRHLGELADFVEWKLQILTKVCPFEWKGMDKDAESTVSVSSPENMVGPDFSGGYVGG